MTLTEFRRLYPAVAPEEMFEFIKVRTIQDIVSFVCQKTKEEHS